MTFNIYAWMILASLAAVFAVEFVARRLNLRALSPDVPPEFRDVFDAEAYRKSQDYTRDRTRFSMVVSSFDLAKLLAFWAAGGFPWLQGLVEAWSASFLWQGLAFVGLLAAASTVLSLPFDVYSTFVIEARYGFNKTDARTFVSDRLKGFALSALLGGPLLAAVLFFFERAGGAAWLYVWAAGAAFLLFVQFIAPAWIMPLFNRFEPLPEGDLRSAIERYAASVNYPLRGLYVMDGSKRSTKSNAFFTGFGRNRRIALFDTLIARHTVDELVAVLAHEIGHDRLGHIRRGLAASILQFGAVAWLLGLALNEPGLYQAFGLDDTPSYAGLVFFSTLFTPASFALSIVMHGLSRKHEFQADRYAVDTTGRVQPLRDALKKLAASNLSNLTPHPFYVFLTYTHPPLSARLSAAGAAAGGAGPVRER